MGNWLIHVFARFLVLAGKNIAMVLRKLSLLSLTPTLPCQLQQCQFEVLYPTRKCWSVAHLTAHTKKSLIISFSDSGMVHLHPENCNFKGENDDKPRIQRYPLFRQTHLVIRGETKSLCVVRVRPLMSSTPSVARDKGTAADARKRRVGARVDLGKGK